MQDSVRDEVRQLWQQHLDRPFPPRVRGEEVDGVDMVMLDADIAGCVDTWLGSSSDLDAARIGILRACFDDVDRVLPNLSDPSENAYYSALRDLAIAVFEAPHGPSG